MFIVFKEKDGGILCKCPEFSVYRKQCRSIFKNRAASLKNSELDSKMLVDSTDEMWLYDPSDMYKTFPIAVGSKTGHLAHVVQGFCRFLHDLKLSSSFLFHLDTVKRHGKKEGNLKQQKFDRCHIAIQ